MNDLKKRLTEICYKHKLGHLGSYYSALDIIDGIYAKKREDDIFILSSGHAALALYVVLEKYQGVNAEELFLKHGGHPHRDEENGIYCSTGSLGLGITVAVGRALANKNRTVYCLISDGEAAEGSVWEALRFIQDHPVWNLEVHVNANGYCAYDEVNVEKLKERLHSFLHSVKVHETKVEHLPCLHGLNAHYHVMSEEDYNEAMK